MQDTSVNPERNDVDGGEVESLFSLALDARCESALMWLYVTSGDVGTPAFDRHRRRAYDLARRAGYHYADEPIPHLLRDDDELTQAWEHGIHDQQVERREALAAVEREGIKKLIAAKDWPALKLPFPEQILETLRDRKPVHVEGHCLYSEEDYIYCVNPYGIELLVSHVQDLTPDDIEHFLADMALGEEWGPVPY